MSRSRAPQEDSLNLGLAILRNLVSFPTSRGVTQIAKEMGLAVSTAHDLLRLMCELGFIIQDAANHRYRISPQFFGFIEPFASRFGIVPRVQGFIRDQAAARGITIYVSALWGENTYVVCPAGKHGGTVSLGSQGRAYASSCAKVLIAQMPPARWKEYAPTAASDRTTPYTNIDPEVFLAEIEQAHNDGVAYNERETASDTYSIATPLTIPGTSIDYALGLVYSAEEWSALSQEERIGQVRQVALELVQVAMLRKE